MTSSAFIDFRGAKVLTALAVIAASAFSSVAHAQQIYRIVGPDGKVTFSDQAPPAAKSAPLGGTANTAPPANGAGLPFELRQLVAKYPVTLYSSDGCEPCNSGRALLTGRGIPFTEKTVNTAEDTQALERLSGASSLPFITVGSQQIKGFSDAEWTQYLNAAGYPASSALPASYRAPAPVPLVALAPAPAAAATPAANAPGGLPVRPKAAPSVSSPGGIRF